MKECMMAISNVIVGLTMIIFGSTGVIVAIVHSGKMVTDSSVFFYAIFLAGVSVTSYNTGLLNKAARKLS